MSSKEQTRSNDKESAKQRLAKPASANLNRVAQPQPHPATIIQRAKLDPRSLTPGEVLQLQRTIGNQAVGRLLAQMARHHPTQKMSLAQKQGPALIAHESAPEMPQGGGAVQRQGDLEEEEALQGKFGRTVAPMQFQTTSAPGENRTGMPDPLKAGLEHLSGLDMSGVRVHYNSPKPVQLNAFAYTQGQDIEVGPGQERHLPHEGWHVVQQMQGRVQPTLQAKGVSINAEAALEREADVVGAKALQMTPSDQVATNSKSLQRTKRAASPFRVFSHPSLSETSSDSLVVQGVFFVDVIGADGQVEQIDLHSVDSISDLEKYVRQMLDDELNDPDVRKIIEATYVILQQKESDTFTSKALRTGAAAKEAPGKLFAAGLDAVKSTLGIGQTGTEQEKTPLSGPTSGIEAQSEQLGRDVRKMGVDTLAGQGVSEGANLLMGHSVPGIGMVVGAARSGQLIFRGISAESPIDPAMALVAARARAEGYEEIPDEDPVSAYVKAAIKDLAKGQAKRGGSAFASAATGTTAGVLVGGALTAPIGAVPGAIVGGIIGGVVGLITSIGAEKGIRDIMEEKNAVKTLVKVILKSNQQRGRTVASTRDRTVGYGATSATTTSSDFSGTGGEARRQGARTARHQSPDAQVVTSYQNAPHRGPDQTNIDALAAYSALMRLGVSEESLQSLTRLQESVIAELKIG